MRNVLRPAELICALFGRSAVPAFVGAFSLLFSSAPAVAVAPALFESRASYVRAEDHQVANIAYRLALSGGRFCPDTHPLSGLFFHHLAEYGPEERRQLIALYGLDRGPGVLSVVEGSPAARAGIAAGDVLLAVNGRSLPTGASTAQHADRQLWRRAAEQTEAQVEQELRLGTAKLSLVRNGRTIQTTLEPIPGCPARIRLARSPQVNGFVAGRYVVMTTGLLGFTQDEDELAVVIAHEMAHLILRHTERLQALGVPRGERRREGRNASLVRVTEEEADRLGLKLAWAAGYDVSAAIPFWRRYYAKYDRGLQLFRTHPSIRAREKLIRETLAELGGSNPGAQRPQLREGALRQR